MRRIAWLSSGAIFVAVTAFLVVLFVMSGMNRSIQDRILALEPHLSLWSPDAGVSIEKDPAWIGLHARPLRLSRFESADVILRTLDGQFRGAQARGMDRDTLIRFMSEIRRLRDSVAPPRSRVDERQEPPLAAPGEGEVLLGVDLARSLGVFEGDTITVVPPESLLLPPGENPRFEQVRVRQVISTNLADLDGRALYYVRGETLKALRKSPALNDGVDVWLPPGEDVDRVKEELSVGSRLKIETWIERNSALFFALRMEKTMIGTFLGLAGLIAASSILTVMSLLLAQKKTDIALLRVVGLSGRATVGLFTKMGLLLAAFSVGGGLLVGTGLGLYIETHPLNILPDIYYDSQIPAQVDFRLVFWALIVAAAIAFLGAWLPARTTSRLPMSETLRK